MQGYEFKRKIVAGGARGTRRFHELGKPLSLVGGWQSSPATCKRESAILVLSRASHVRVSGVALPLSMDPHIVVS